MKKYLMLLIAAPMLMGADSCYDGANPADAAETRVVDRQQLHYLAAQPIPFYDFSLQRDVYTQIYNATNEARQTYTIVESMTGETKWACASVGYGIPADMSLTNPLKGERLYQGTVVTEQPEPNGLYSSGNTDGTWILCVMDDGSIAPIYTEHKVNTFPFFVDGVEAEWTQRSGSQPTTTVTIR